MMRAVVCFVLVLLVCTIQFASTASPSRFANFLLHNKFETSNLPLSYKVPANYWKNIPVENRNNASRFEAACGRIVSIQELDAYTAQTEQMLTTAGINLYDAAAREIALALLGHADVAQQYEKDTLIGAKTFQFASIKANAPCRGISYFGQCNDSDQTGSCGFCYGGNTGQKTGVTLNTNQAYFFRMIGDVYAFDGTIDQRCPEKNMPWTWNDWRPVTGENAWASFIGPLQVAYKQAGGNANNIPDDSVAMQLAAAMFSAFQTAQMPNGAIAYAPYNTWDSENPVLGGTGSVENAASALAGLKAFLTIIENKQSSQYKNLVPQLQSVMTKLTEFIKTSYDPGMGYFRQGGTYYEHGWEWNNDPSSSFAVDCQTWVISVIGATTVDSWFGQGTTLSIWALTKKVGGYFYNAQTGTVYGLGFSQNQQVQVFSGEWTFGAVNMLRVIANQLPDHAQALRNEADDIRQAIDDYLTSTDNSISSDVVNYANKRYWIPWGWYANPIPSLASVSWAVMVDSNFNPFTLGGSY